MSEDFDVVIERGAIASQVDDDTILVTAQKEFNKNAERLLMSAVQQYTDGQVSGVKFAEVSSNNLLTIDQLNSLVSGVNSSLKNVLELNRHVKRFILTDDILGFTYTAVQANLNTKYRLRYGSTEGRNKQKQLKSAKQLIENFNRAVRLPRVIFNSVLGCFTEGTYIMYLRLDGDQGAVIDTWPLGVAEISDYTMNGDPIVQINLDEFKARLRKTYPKDRKGKALYFENLEKEVKANFPQEVYKAFQNNEKYAKLEVSHTGVMRINNFGMRYGISHFVKSLKPTIRLNELEDADAVLAKARKKTVLAQLMNKEVMGVSADYTRKGFEYAAFAHSELVKAWRANNAVLYTAIPAVRELKYIEPASESTPSEKIALYRNEKMVSLGVSYTDPTLGSVSAANISLKQLMKTIDAIADQLSEIISRFYRIMLMENNVDQIYAPDIEVLDSEQMEWDIKKDLVEMLFSKINGSYETCFELLGIDVDDEFAKRDSENKDKYDEVFAPHASQYTSSSNNVGRPKGDNNPDKQEYDKESRVNGE